MRLTVREAADRARRHPDTILKALQRGELPGIQRVRAGKWLVDEADLEAWITGDVIVDLPTYRRKRA